MLAAQRPQHTDLLAGAQSSERATRNLKSDALPQRVWGSRQAEAFIQRNAERAGCSGAVRKARRMSKNWLQLRHRLQGAITR
jgi:hypothetical protein